MTACHVCGAAIEQPATGRRRKFCSERCRRRAQARTPVSKPVTCERCSATIEQPPTGRPRVRCAKCAEYRTHHRANYARVFDAEEHGADLGGIADCSAEPAIPALPRSENPPLR